MLFCCCQQHLVLLSHKQTIQSLSYWLSQPVSDITWSNYCSAHLLLYVLQHAHIQFTVCEHMHTKRQTTKQRYRQSNLWPSVSVQCVANCLNVWLLQWNTSEKLIMWHHSETHYELWMNFTLVDEILLCEFSENNIVYWVGGSLACLSLIFWASQMFHNLHNFIIIV